LSGSDKQAATARLKELGNDILKLYNLINTEKLGFTMACLTSPTPTALDYRIKLLPND